MVGRFIGFVSEGSDNVKLCALCKTLVLISSTTFLWDGINKCIWKFDVQMALHRVKFLYIKPTRFTYFSDLLLEWNSACFGQVLCPSSGVFHCTHSNSICHTGLLTACKQDQDGTQDLSRRAACGRSPAEILGSNPTGGMDICLFWVSCVVR